MGRGLIAVGLGIVQGTAGVVPVTVGIVPLSAVLLDICLIEALFFSIRLWDEEIRHLNR